MKDRDPIPSLDHPQRQEGLGKHRAVCRPRLSKPDMWGWDWNPGKCMKALERSWFWFEFLNLNISRWNMNYLKRKASDRDPICGTWQMSAAARKWLAERGRPWRGHGGVTGETEGGQCLEHPITQTATREESLRNTICSPPKESRIIYRLDPTYPQKRFVYLRDTHVCKHREIKRKKDSRNHEESARRWLYWGQEKMWLWYLHLPAFASTPGSRNHRTFYNWQRELGQLRRSIQDSRKSSFQEMFSSVSM